MLGGIMTAIFGSASAKKQAKMLQGEKDKNQRWYDQRYNEVGTERADAQASLTKLREMIKDNDAKARGINAVSGGTSEDVATQKAAQAEAMGNVVSGINVNAENRKDNIEAQYNAKDAALTDQQMNAERAKQQAIAAAGTAIDGTISNAMGMFNPLNNTAKGGVK